MKRKPTLGILGAGKLGTTLGRIFIKAGYPVMISGSKDVEKIALTVEVLVPNAIAATKENVIEAADIIILALPLSKMDTIPTTHIKDKIVIDTMNYWWEVDGVNRIPSDPTISSSELVSKTIGSNRVVKAYNHMGYHDLEFETHAKDRKVIALASDDEDAKMIVANGTKYYVEVSNMPTTPEATSILLNAGIIVAPSKACNAGGVAVSGLEMSQNSSRISWSSEEVDQKLKNIMKNIHDASVKAAARYNLGYNLIAGANIAGFEKVAEAMLAQGVI